jgi:hypothetical protein
VRAYLTLLKTHFTRRGLIHFGRCRFALLGTYLASGSQITMLRANSTCWGGILLRLEPLLHRRLMSLGWGADAG